MENFQDFCMSGIPVKKVYSKMTLISGMTANAAVWRLSGFIYMDEILYKKLINVYLCS